MGVGKRARCWTARADPVVAAAARGRAAGADLRLPPPDRLGAAAGRRRDRLRNGKAERFHQTMAREWAYDLAYHTHRHRNQALPH